MANPKGPKRVNEMVELLRRWQRLERQAMSDTAEILEQTQNPLIRMIMEIILHDSHMHHRVQQFLIESLTTKDVAVSREDVAEIWEKIEAHDKHERQTIELAAALKEKAWSPVHKQLLGYLLTDESKHDTLLDQLNEFKKGMSRASGG
ncbi:MAG: hypothetical protein A2Y61_06690 [Chloroflexi bacterium RBG_13_60_13]|nr:MAG: hypothetical protein A2Y61_06690 [Chloroflexi bacterium RBG_13_60_13]